MHVAYSDFQYNRTLINEERFYANENAPVIVGCVCFCKTIGKRSMPLFAGSGKSAVLTRIFEIGMIVKTCEIREGSLDAAVHAYLTAVKT